MTTDVQQTTKIRDALKQLDAGNDDHWTDDGLPRTGVVQKIASDQTIKRTDIQAAWPGFQRHPATNKPAIPSGVGAPPPGMEDPLTGEPQANMMTDPADNEGELMTEDEVREILNQRVVDALASETAAQDKLKEGQQELTEARKRLLSARAEYQREFPPKTAAQNIKEYLAAEQARRAAAAGVYNNGGLSGAQIDSAMQRSNSRGWKRPTRGGRQTVTSGVNTN